MNVEFNSSQGSPMITEYSEIRFQGTNYNDKDHNSRSLHSVIHDLSPEWNLQGSLRARLEFTSVSSGTEQCGALDCWESCRDKTPRHSP